jgi:hypothetical protein
MVFSEILIKYPYRLLWKLASVFNKTEGVIFYVESEHDYQVFKYVFPYINFPYKVVANTYSLARRLYTYGLKAKVWPVFPEVVVMARHAFHRFPDPNIKRIGLRHGPYHFKKMIGAEKYNAFDLFLFTSENEVAVARTHGVKVGVAGGYPKLDAFRDPVVMGKSRTLFIESGFNTVRKTILFTATWDRSGLSAIDQWAERLHELQDRYNLVVSLHPAMSLKYMKKVAGVKGAVLTSSEDLPAWMLAADYLVGDTSSVLAEFCALNKPVITFKVNPGRRLTPEIIQMIQDISVQIDHFDQLPEAIGAYEADPMLRQEQRENWNRIIFDDVHADQGLKAATIIEEFLNNS